MIYIVDHKLVFIKFDVPARVQGGKIVLSCADEGELPPVRHPGRLIIEQNARYTRRIYIGDLRTRLIRRRAGRGTRKARCCTLDVEIFTPDGLLFTPDHVTLENLRRFRDLRGCSHGVWRYRMRGWKEYVVDPDAYRIEGGQGSLHIRLEESVYSKSAPPVVDVLMRSRKRRFNFDLFRVGEFVADAWRWRSSPSKRTPPKVKLSRRSRTGRHKVGVKKTLRLLDPDGNQVASGVSKRRSRRNRDGQALYAVPPLTRFPGRGASFALRRSQSHLVKGLAGQRAARQ